MRYDNCNNHPAEICAEENLLRRINEWEECSLIWHLLPQFSSQRKDFEKYQRNVLRNSGLETVFRNAYTNFRIKTSINDTDFHWIFNVFLYILFFKQKENKLISPTHREIFSEFSLKQTQIRLYLLFSDLFRTKRKSDWFWIDRKMVNTIWFNKIL